MSNSIAVKLNDDTFEINPGDKIETDISVRNTGTIVDVFNIEITGLNESWNELSVSRVSLFPGDSANVKLTISVPRESGAKADTYPFTLNVTSDKAPTATNSVECELRVLPFYEYQTSIKPQSVAGAFGNFTVTLENNGNSELNCFLEGSDPESLCQFSFEPSRSPSVAAGAKADVNVIVEPGQRPLRRSSKVYNLTFSVKPRQDAAPPASLNAVFEATPRLPGWAIPAAIASVVALVAIVALAVVLTRGPSTIETPFLLNPGEGITVAFQLPEAKPMRLELTAEWEGGADALDVTLERPDSSQLSAAKVTRADPTARFALDESEVDRGLIGWKISVRNPHDTGQADGVLFMNRQSLN